MQSQDGTGAVAQAWASERRLATVQIVASEYSIVSGCVLPTSDVVSRQYLPFAAPAALSEFRSIMPGDAESVVRYCHRWGSLGFDRLTLDHDIAEWSAVSADPLPWVWAHASGIRVALALIPLVREGRGTEVAAFLRALRAPQGSFDLTGDLTDELEFWSYAAKDGEGWVAAEDEDPVPAPALMAAGMGLLKSDGPVEHGLIFAAREQIRYLDPPYLEYVLEVRDPFRAATVVLEHILNPHLRGISEELRGGWSRDYSDRPINERFGTVTAADSLISVLYWHVKNLLFGATLRECEECGSPFVPGDARQRFCPPDGSAKTSRCRDRHNKRKRRQAQRGGVS